MMERRRLEVMCVDKVATNQEQDMGGRKYPVVEFTS